MYTLYHVYKIKSLRIDFTPSLFQHFALFELSTVYTIDMLDNRYILLVSPQRGTNIKHMHITKVTRDGKLDIKETLKFNISPRTNKADRLSLTTISKRRANARRNARLVNFF